MLVWKVAGDAHLNSLAHTCEYLCTVICRMHVIIFYCQHSFIFTILFYYFVVASSIFYSDQSCDNWRSTHTPRSEINPNASHWHWWSWLTRVTLMVGSSCCPPHLTPTPLLPSLTQFMSKLDWRQRSQCGTGEKTPSYFYFSATKSLFFFLQLFKVQDVTLIYVYCQCDFTFSYIPAPLLWKKN